MVATFDVDRLHDYRARRPPMSFVRDHYEAYDAPRLVVRLLQRHRPDAVPAAARAGTRHPLGGVRRRGTRGRGAVRRHPRGRDGVGADGGAAHPTDRDHPPRQRRRPADRGEPVARRAADPEQCAGAARDQAGGVGTSRRWASWRTSRTTWRSSTTRAPRPRCSSRSSSPDGSRSNLTDLHALAEEREGEITRYLAANEEVARRRGGPRAAVRRVRARRGARDAACSRRDQPLPTGEEIGQQFEQFLAGLEGPDDGGRQPGRRMTDAQSRDARSWSTCSTSSTSTSTCSAAASPTRCGSGSTAGRWLRRRWLPRPARSTTTSRCTRCTRTSCCPATTRCRSSTTWSGSETAAPSPPGG